MVNIIVPGMKFGKLTVIKYSHTNRYKYWECQCDCGNTKIVKSDCLNSGTTKSCGCLLQNRGESKSRLYHQWNHAKNSCYNRNQSNYRYYGQKGISFCNEWRNSFKEFKNWALNNGYSEELSFLRKDKRGNYDPDNCYFGTIWEQRSGSGNVILEYNGEKHSISEWARKIGVSRATLWARIYQLGMTSKEAIEFKKNNKRVLI